MVLYHKKDKILISFECIAYVWDAQTAFLLWSISAGGKSAQEFLLVLGVLSITPQKWAKISRHVFEEISAFWFPFNERRQH